MNSNDDDKRRQPKPRPKTRTRHTNKGANPDLAPAAHRGHTFPTSIQIVIDESATFSTAVQEWLARCVGAFLQAVKHQLALLAAPPERKLLPPAAPPDEHKDDPIR